jgi:localization factor PodJL
MAAMPSEQALRSPDESYRLALRYLEADGVPRDERRAASLLTDAAELDHAEAQVLLANAYADGLGVEREPAWATLWFGRAAAQGQAEGQYRLALALAHGDGTNPDVVAAFQWLTIAANAGHAEAARAREALAGRMIRQEIEPAERAAKRWRPATTRRDPDEPLVRFVQFALQQLGYKPGPTDGVLGRQTRTAVAAFGRREQIAGHGITPALVERLRARLVLVQSAETNR